MQLNNDHDHNDISNELDDIIVKMLIPITNSLLMKTKELREKKLEFRKELNEMKHKRQALIQKRKRLEKQKTIHEKNLNGDFSNTKVCEELLINYINFVDKKESDFIKSKDDFYELKLRSKKLPFNYDLINLIKEKSNIEKKKKLEIKDSFECMNRINKSSYSVSKNNNNINKSFSIDKSYNKSLTKTITTVTPNKTDINSFKKNDKNKNSYMRNKSSDNNRNSNKGRTDISREIEHLINNYTSKKKDAKTYNSESTENFNEGLIQIKELNKETKEIEKDLKAMMDNLLNDENE